MKNEIHSTLQIEFKNRQQCKRFLKIITKNKLLFQFFDFKAENCIWLKFKDGVSRQRVKDVLIKNVKDCQVMYRSSGIDYLFIK